MTRIVKLPRGVCTCGLRWQLCCALAFLEIMCCAACNGEVRTAQHAAWRILDLIENF